MKKALINLALTSLMPFIMSSICTAADDAETLMNKLVTRLTSGDGAQSAKKMKVGVLDFKKSMSLSGESEEAALVRDEVETALSMCDAVELYTRHDLDALEQEFDFQQTFVDPDDDSAINKLKFRGVDALIRGQYVVKNATIRIYAEIVRVEDGKVLAKGKAEIENPALEDAVPVAENGAAAAILEDALNAYMGVDDAPNYAKAAAGFLQAAKLGDAEAQFWYGTCCMIGKGVPQDAAAAEMWFGKAAKQGNADAQNSLGAILQQKGEFAQAFSLYKQAAAQGDPNGMCNVAICYFNGFGVAADPYQAVKWYQKSAEKGHAQAAGNLGYCYMQGVGVERDMTKALGYIRKAAEAGDMEAQNNLSSFYRLGNAGLPKDIKQCMYWLHKALEQGSRTAQFNLGMMHFTGELSKNDTEAVNWCTKSADNGYSLAQYTLALWYLKGMCGLQKDPAKGIALLQAAAEQGLSHAIAKLGQLYLQGTEVEQNTEKAVAMLKQATDLGSPAAPAYLGEYLWNNGQKQEAAKYFTISAERDFADAQRLLGNLYRDGSGVPKNKEKAKEWYAKAAAQGDEQAAAELKKLQTPAKRKRKR